ncbi:MAG: cellulase family glycosylhydrolase [Candidatus Bathyarchaeia archaeon]
MERIGFINPRKSQEIDGSPFGIGCEDIINPVYPYKISDANFPKNPLSPAEIAEYVASLGVKWCRIWAEWPLIVTSNGKYKWDKMDEAIEELTKRKIRPFICLCSHYGSHFELPPTTSTEKMRSWLNFVKVLVERYCEKVSHWEIWNEPNTAYFWKPEPNVEEYALLVKEVSKTIKNIDPNAVILAGVTAMVDMEFSERLLARGTSLFINKFVFHPYGEIPEETIKPINQLKRLLEMQENRIGLWQGECGYPSTENTAGWYGTGPWGEKIQAKWILRRLLTDLSIGVEVSCIYTLLEQMAEIENPESDDYGKEGVNTKGLLRFGLWQPKPSYFAYQNLTSLIDNSFSLSASLSPVFKVLDQGIFHGLLTKRIMTFICSKLDQTLLAYWLPWRPQEIIKYAKVNIYLEGQGKIEEPVLIDLLDGSVYEIDQYVERKNKMEFLNLPLADYPMVLTSLKLVNVAKK